MDLFLNSMMATPAPRIIMMAFRLPSRKMTVERQGQAPWTM
ncbi:hypothetical protein ACWJIA_09000 [Lactobacillus crispatus]